MITRDSVLRNARIAGGVVRYHAWPMIQKQTVADHCYHCCRIYFSIWGPLPPQISTHLIWHDSGELVSGDPPYPSKAKNLDLKQACDRIEKQAVLAMGGVVVELSEEERVKCKIVDLLDMWEHGLMEIRLGNNFGTPITSETLLAAQKLADLLSEKDELLVNQYVTTMATMLSV